MNQQQLMNLFGGSLGGSGGGSGGMGELAALLGQSGRQRSHARAAAAAAAAASSSSTTSSSSSATRSTPAPSSTTTAAATTTTTAATTASPAATAPATSTTTATSGANIQLSDLQNILSGLGTPGGSQGASGPPVDLAAGLTAEAMRPLLSNPDFVKRMKELLPAEHQGEADLGEEIRGTVSSPQFQQALSLFSSAFQSAQLAPLIREFDLGDEAVAAATAGDMEAFVKALQKKSKDAGDDKKKDEPEDMALD